MNVMARSRASAIAGSDGSPVTNASRPRSAASTSEDAAPPEMTPTVRTGSGPNSNASGSRSNALPAALDQLRARERRRRAADEADRPTRVVAEGLGALEPERLADQRVVAYLGVRVQGEVIRGERHVRREQDLEPLAALGVDHERLLAPEHAVVAEHHLGALRGRAAEQLEVRRDAGDDRRHLRSSDHLESVRAVVVEARRVEQVVEERDDVLAGRHRR
jgi:hypothetical protein